MCIGQIDKLLVGSLISLEALSYYAVAQSLASKIHIFAISIGRVLMPYFSSREASHGSAQLAGPLMQSWKATLMISMATVSLAAATSLWLLRLWLPGDVAGHALPAYLFFIGSYGLHAVNVVPYYYLVGRGRPDQVAWFTLAGGAAMLGLIALLAKPFGVVAAAASSLAFPLVCSLMAVSALRMTDGIEAEQRLSSGFGATLAIHVTAIAGGLAAGAATSMLHSSALSIIAAALTCALVLGAGLAGCRRSDNSYYATLWAIINRVTSRQT